MISAKQLAAIITGTMASPSSPSVRLTALEAPTITSIPNGMKKNPRSTSRFFRNGTAICAVSSGGLICARYQVAMPAMVTSASSFSLPGTPR